MLTFELVTLDGVAHTSECYEVPVKKIGPNDETVKKGSTR